MENKYFTPDIEDLYVGYKLEIKGPHDVDWQPIVLGKDAIWHQFTNLENLGQAMEQLRVPYLTKEQIEAEGWIDNTLCYQTPELFVGLQNSQTWRKLVYKFSDNVLQIVEVDDYYIYSGQCKDINTFRKIIKLLGI
jgi:hypothetical protein